MIEGITYDDGEQPAIGLVPPGTSWDEIRDHIKISHGPLLIGPGDDGQYSGAHWTGNQMVVEEELGDDAEDAISDFRDLLNDIGWL